MTLLKTINPEKVEESDISNWEYRQAARAVVFDKEGKIGLLNVKNHNYYKLPGGGIEKGEDIKTALDRECEEELGVEIDVLKEIGSVIEYRKKWKIKQISYCFVAKTNSEKKASNFTDREKNSGFEAVWVEPKEALKLLSQKLTIDYQGKFIEERDMCFLTNTLDVRE